MRGQGRVFKRGAVYWVAYYHRGQEMRESTRSTDAGGAKKLLRERTRKAGTAEFIGPMGERLTFEDLADMYLTDYRANGRRSLGHAARNVSHLRTTFALDRALTITTDRIAAHVAGRFAAGAKPASINRELAALRRMFSLAAKAGKLPHRPHIAMLAEDNARQGFMEPAEFEAVRSHLPPDLADATAFAYATGWRRGEITTLEWRDLDLREGVIRLRPEHSKNKRGRVLVLRGEALAIIQRRAGLRRLDCPFVFHRAGKRLGTFRKTWQKACQAAGLGLRHFHDMRRSAIRNLVRAGVPERVAMEISGHKTRSVFERYNIVSERDLADAMERVSIYVAERRSETPRVVPLKTGTE